MYDYILTFTADHGALQAETYISAEDDLDALAQACERVV